MEPESNSLNQTSPQAHDSRAELKTVQAPAKVLVPGVGVGRAVIVADHGRPPLRQIGVEAVEQEIERLHSGITKYLTRIQNSIARCEEEAEIRGTDSSMVNMHTDVLSVVDNPRIASNAEEKIRNQRVDAASAYYDAIYEDLGIDVDGKRDRVREVERQIARESDPKRKKELEATISMDRFMLDHLLDHIRVRDQVITILNGAELIPGDEKLILVGQEMGLPDLFSIPEERIAGVYVESLHKSSHLLIKLRDRGIPVVECSGLPDCHRLLGSIFVGQTVVIDGEQGGVILNPGVEEEASYTATMQRRHLQDFVPVMGRTADGVRVKLTGNLSDLGGLERIVSSLEGIGLVRTELLLPPDDHLNDLAAQRVVYSAIADSLRGDQSVVYRVFDYTSEDKKELAPTSPVRQFGDMLHQRGLELQLLAMVDACRGRGELSVLFPRIEDPESMRENAALLRNARDTISNRDELLVRAGAQIESRLGITALKSILQGGDVVFIAVGSNDLAADIQRIDRGRDELNHSDPDLLRALAQIAETVKETAEEIGREIPLGLCGGIASVPLYTPMLLGLGYREFSVSGMAAHQVDSVIGKVSIEQCTTLVQHLLELDDSDAITRELERFSQKIQS